MQALIRTILILSLMVLVAPAQGVAGEERVGSGAFYLGRPLVEALLDLRAKGLEILFTNQVVLPGMRVEAEPKGDSPAEILVELLKPHGLEARVTEGGILVVVPRPVPPTGIRGVVRDQRTSRPLADVEVWIPGSPYTAISDLDGSFELLGLAAGSYRLQASHPTFEPWTSSVVLHEGKVADLGLSLVPAPLSLGEIIVTPSLTSLLQADPLPTITFDRQEIGALPHLGDDLFRAMSLLPGISGNELSAEPRVRGGRADEVLVMLDQLELFLPYHLRDFDNALSIIAPKAIAEVDLMLGGFPARYGDRMGGVLDMRTSDPGPKKQGHLGLSLVTVQGGSSGGFHAGKGHWLSLARYGSFELLSDYVSPEDRPRYGDVFAKLEYQPRPSQRLGARILYAEDRLSFRVFEEGDLEIGDTAYGSSYLWLTHQAVLSSRLFVDSILSRGEIDRDRRANETSPDEDFDIRDERSLRVSAFKQDWSFEPGEGHYLRWGFDLRRFDTEYDYLSERDLEDPFEDIRFAPRSGITDFRRRFEGDQISFYLSDRLRWWEPLTLELGLRYDEHRATGDQDLAPRFNLAYALGDASVLRAAWGHYFQTQRLYELRVADGETEFFPSERSAQTVIGYERSLPRGMALRVDAYYRDTEDPRTRYENIFEPITSFPEIEPDRFLYAPERSIARGLEIFFRGPRGPKLSWWLSYVYSRIEDRIEGRTLPRGIDQPHALNADLSYRELRGWTLDLAFRFHTGWPSTAIGGRLEEDDEGGLEPVPVFGPINGERLRDYHRLDLRLSRQWSLGKSGKLSAFLEIQNLYNRKNQAGINVDLGFTVREDGAVDVLPTFETWGGLLPSFGIEWSF